MKPVDTAAITVGERRLTGPDRLLTLLSPSHGRIRAVVRGAGLANSEIGSALAPFGVARVILSSARGEGLYRVEAADRVSTMMRIHSDLIRMQGAGLVCAWARSLAREPEGEAVYRLLHRTLVWLDQPGMAVAPVVARFMWQLAGVAGVAPELSECVGCRDTGRLTGFRLNPGGVVCAGCRVNGDVTVPESGLLALGRLLSNSRSDWRMVGDETARRLVALGQGYLRHHFGARLPAP